MASATLGTLRPDGRPGRAVLLGAAFLLSAACSGSPVVPVVTSATPATTPPVSVSTTMPTAPHTTGTSPTAARDAFELRIAASTASKLRTNPFAVGSGGVFPQSFAAHLYRVLPPTWSLVPELASDDMPPDGESDGDQWVIDVSLNDGLTWSDGEPIDAFDVQYTFEDLSRLGGADELGWAVDDPRGDAALLDVQALDRSRVEFRFSDRPTIDRWQYGIATAAILPEHYWVFTFSDRAPGRETDADLGLTAPSAGAYRFDEAPQPGVWTWRAVDTWWNAGSTYTVFTDGTVDYFNPGLGLQERYGPATTGDVAASWVEGPYAGSVRWTVDDVPARLLLDGEADLFAGPSADLGRLPGDLEAFPPVPSTRVTSMIFDPDRAVTASTPVRVALSCFASVSDLPGLLEDRLLPATDPGRWLPQTLRLWDTGAADPCDLEGEARFAEGMARLRGVGWSWTAEPTWAGEPAAGNGLVDPDGVQPTIDLLAPDETVDPEGAAAGALVERWLAAIGFTVRSSTERKAGEWDIAVETIPVVVPPVPPLPAGTDAILAHLRSASVGVAAGIWPLVAATLRDQALAVPLFRGISPANATRRVVLPYRPLLGTIDPAWAASAVRPST